MYRRVYLKKHYAGTFCMILFCVIVLSGCQKNTGTASETVVETETALHDRQGCPLGELLEYLDEESNGIPYAYARIFIAVDDAGTGEGDRKELSEEDDDDMPDRQDIIKIKGTADILWDTFQTAEEFQQYFSEQEQEKSGLSEGGDNYALELAYYQYQLGEDIHAADLERYLKEIYDEEENPLYAITMDGMRPEGSYCFSQSGIREMVVVGNNFCGLEWKNNTSLISGEDVREFLMAYSMQKQEVQDLYYNGWVMREEILYWIDHEERISSFEDPARRFTEVRGIDTTWEGAPYMENFALLKEADYEVRLCEDGLLLGLHFTLAEEIPPSGYEAYLSNGFCTDEDYIMTVTDLDRDEILQMQNVKMSIEMADAITFTDLDGDGYLDMRIDLPVHWSGEKTAMDEYGEQSFLLWEPQEGAFAEKSGSEIAQRLLEQEQDEAGRQEEETDFVEYVVQPGDTLWGISRRFYGSGIRYTEIESANAEILSAYPYLMPGTTLQVPAPVPFP